MLCWKSSFLLTNWHPIIGFQFMMSKIVHDTCTYKTDLSLIFIIIFDVNIFINFVEKIWGGGQTFWPHPTFFKNEITSNIAMQIQLQADIHTFFYKQLRSWWVLKIAYLCFVTCYLSLVLQRGSRLHWREIGRLAINLKPKYVLYYKAARGCWLLQL